jgi:beta-lactamase regulating signal transducer with metallopeptidase domain
LVRSPAWWDWWREAGPAHWALATWVAGAAGWYVWQGRRIVRFQRRFARAEDAGPEVAAATRRIALALGVVRPPAVKATTGIGSPMLWGWGRGTVILFPRELLARLAPEARDTLLAHELAHFLRRDHWVRLLEFLATGLYWWHPAVWLARAGIEAAEEECCDSWVVGGYAASPRRYAEALLATIDFVAELRRPCLPPGACAANRSARLLRRRLFGIIHADRPSQLRGAAAVRAAAVAVLLIQPVLRAATPESTVSSQESAVESPTGFPESYSWTAAPSPSPVPKSAEPRAWATAPAPGGTVTVVARDNEVVLRRPDGTASVLGPGKPLALAFAPDGQRLATAGPGDLVRTWDYQGNLLAEAHVPAAARGVAYTPDGDWLLVLDAAGGISVRDPQTLASVTGWSVEGPANSIACAPDGQTVAVAFGSWLAETGWVECWSIPEQRKLACYRASAPVGATRFGPDGRTLVIGGWNGLLAWRTLPGGELVAERQMPKALVAAAAFSPDAGTLPLEPPPEPAPSPTPVPQTVPDLLQGVGHFPAR